MAQKVKTKPVSNENLASAIDSLARITAKGFERLEARMDDFDKGLKILTETVQNLANKLTLH
jgi:hypothetical protein